MRRDEVEIRLTVGGSSSDVATGSTGGGGGGLCGDLGCGGGRERQGSGGRGRGQAERAAEGRARHEAEVVEAVERLVLEHGIGGATTVPAAFAVRPRSLSNSSSSSSSSSAHGEVVGLVREKRVTLVSAALDPASFDDAASNSDERDVVEDGEKVEVEEAAEDVLFGACKAPPPKDEDAVGEALGEVCITVPSTMDKDLLLSQHEHERYVMNVVQRLIPVAGRVTAVPAVGFWMLETATTNSIATGDRLMQERVTIVSAACVVDAKVRSVVKETATWLANALGQEAVFVKINNQPYLIRMTSERGENEAVERKEKKVKKARGRRHNKNYRFFKVAPTMVYECNHQA